MRSSTVNFVVLWLALCGQVVGAVLAGGGGILCSEADGQIKIEFSMLECCGPNHNAGTDSDSAQKDSCSETNCVDRLIDEAKPLVGRTKDLIDAAFGQVVPQVAPLLVDHQPRDVWPNMVTAFKPPHEPTLVRAVVFLL